MKHYSIPKQVRLRARLPAQRGALLVEFVLVAPFILFLLGYILRLTLVLQAQQIAMTLSRELATTIFRECADITILQAQAPDGALRVDTVSSATATSRCLTTARADLLNRWAQISPIGAPNDIAQVALNLTIYRHGFVNLGAADNCPCAQGDCATTAISPNGSQVGNTDIDAAIMCQRNRVVRVQLGFQLTPLFAFLNLIPGPDIPNAIPINEETII